MGTLSHVINDGLLWNFDVSSGYLPVNLQNVLISFLAEKSWLKVHLQAWHVEKKSCHNYGKPDLISGEICVP